MEMQRKLKAALYIRVSTEEQAIDGQSASAQAETLKQYCYAFDIEIFDIYMDMGISGKSLKDRNELKRLIDDCSNSYFDMVLVWKISRLSRNLKDLLYLIDIFEKHSVHFASYSEKFDTGTPVGRMTLQLLGSIAEFERNTIVDNVKLGLKEFARKGGKASSVLGYDNTDKKLIVNESEAKIIKLMFSLYTDANFSFSAIAKYLNSLGHRTKRGSKFRSSSISYAIRNPVYIGINRHRINTKNEYSIKNAHQAIISTEQWDKAQSIIPKLKKSGVSTSHCPVPSPFQVTCMKCNSLMRVFYAYSKGKKYKYMRCSNCSNYVNVEKLMKAVSKEFLAIINDKVKQKAAYNLINQTHTVYWQKSIEIASIESEIIRLQKSRTRYLKLFEDYKISDTAAFINRISEIELQLELLEKKKLALGKAVLSSNNATDYEEYFWDLKNRLSSLEPVILKQLSDCLIKSIEVYKNEIKIVLYL